MTATILRADAAHLPIPDASVDLICTSPPYFGLRSYTDGGAHYGGQVGDEATPAEYLDALAACTADWVRVLKPGGSIFVNLGDKYVADNRGSGSDAKRGEAKWAPAGPAGYPGEGIMPRKSLMGLPWRYALRCIDDLGLILRAEIVWAKPNGLPESVTDRVRRSHEQVFHFVKQPRYYSAVDEVREEHAEVSKRIEASAARKPGGYSPLQRAKEVMPGRAGEEPQTGRPLHPLGKLPGSVWTIATAPLTVPAHLGVDHFAAFPPELVRRIVLGWSPREVCSACGEGRRPVSDKGGLSEEALALIETRNARDNYSAGARGNGDKSIREHQKLSGIERARMTNPTTITGYACACPDTTAPATPGVVLDPFMGTGTTLLVADCYGRRAIGTDLSADYCRLARWRTTDPGERARVLQVPKPEPVPEGQLGLFEGLEPTPPKPSGGLAYAEKKGRNCQECGYRTQYAGPTCDRCGAERGAA